MENLKILFIAENGMNEQDAQELSRLNEKLVSLMLNEVVTFSFKKSDGSERVAVGTLVETMLPEVKGMGKPLSPKLQIYFDVEKQAFRSFTKANLLTIK